MSMKNRLTEAIGLIDEKYLNECYEKREKRKRARNKVKAASAVAACLAVVIGITAVIPQISKRNEPHTLPETTVGVTEPVAKYPWQDGYTGDQHGSGGIGGTYNGCPEHGYSEYHSIEGSLISFVGKDAFRKWLDDNRVIGIDGFCSTHYNIKNLIDDFNISREDFDEVVDLTSSPYNIDLLYTKDAEYIDEYYKNKTFIRIKEGRGYFYSELCDAVRDHIMDEQPEIDHLALWPQGVPELVSAYSIERTVLESLIAKVSKDAETFNYDLDMLYNEDGTIKELPVYNADDTERSRRGKLNEAFCRVYEDWGDPADYPADEPEELPVLGEGICTVHHRDYHNAPYNGLKDEYPELYEEYSKLIESTGKDSGDCRLSEYYNVKSFIEFFGLSRDEAILRLGTNFYVHDIDFILSADGEAVNEYFSDINARAIDYHKNTNYWYVNLMLRGYYRPADESRTAFSFYTVPIMIHESRIPRDELEALLEEVKRLREPTNLYYFGYYNVYDYNLDLLYNEDGTMKDLPPFEGEGRVARDKWLSDLEAKFCGLIPIE